MHTLVFIFLQTILFKKVYCNQIEIEHPIIEHRNTTAYEFIPQITIIGFGFTFISFFLLIIAKLMYNSSDHYMMNNRYDLIIFKPPTKHSLLELRRVYKNSEASEHNLNAALSSGFDITKITNRKQSDFYSDEQSDIPKTSEKI